MISMSAVDLKFEIKAGIIDYRAASGFVHIKAIHVIPSSRVYGCVRNRAFYFDLGLG